MIPMPVKLEMRSGSMPLNETTRIVVDDEILLPQAQLLANDLSLFRLPKLQVLQDHPQEGDIALAINSSLAESTYQIAVSDRAMLKAGSEQALSHATVTLLQAMKYTVKSVELPCMDVEDRPAIIYRGLMVDLARKWHTFRSLEMLVNLCRWYKLNYLHLHLTDDQSYTFPSKAYPKLPTPDRHYTMEQMKKLEQFARLRGVTILPELDMPGHSRALLKTLPRLVACSGGPEGSDICPGRETTYGVMETLISEMCEVFKASEWFHIGADETVRTAWKNCEYCRQRIADEGLEDEEGLYRYFIIRMNEIVRKLGKKTMVWEGFAPGGKLRVPNDVTVMVFESDYNIAPDLVADGYPVINTSWQPLYVTSRGLCWPAASIYRWNYLRWESPFQRSKAYIDPIQMDETPAVFGAQLCSWGQDEAAQLPSLRDRVAAMSERVWNPEYSDFTGFFERLEQTDTKFTRFMYSGCAAEKVPFWIKHAIEKA